MVLEQGVKVYQSLLEQTLDYVNKNWRMSYKLEDIAGLEIGLHYMFLHFDKENYSKKAYPINLDIILKS